MDFVPYLDWVDVPDEGNPPEGARMVSASDLLRYERGLDQAAGEVTGLADRLAALEYDSGPRNVSSLLANGWTGTAYLQRTGSDVQLRLEGVTAPSSGSTSPYVFGPGFMPRGSGFAARGLLFTTATNPVVRRFDVAATTGQLTIRNVTAGDVLYGEVAFKTDNPPAPGTEPGTPA